MNQESPESSTMFLIRSIPVKHVVKNVHRITQQQEKKIIRIIYFIFYSIRKDREEDKKNFVKKKVSSSGINYNKLNNISMNRENCLISDLLISVSRLLLYFPKKNNINEKYYFSLDTVLNFYDELCCCSFA